LLKHYQDTFKHLLYHWKVRNRLYEYYKNLAPEFPDTLEAMAPLYAAVTHGCPAGRQQEALNVYWRRICRGTEVFSSKKLGAMAADLTALAAFFEPPWKTPTSSLPAADQAFLLNVAGFGLYGLGRLTEAQEAMQAGLERRITQESWQNASFVAQNLTNIAVLRGELEQAEALARQALGLAERSAEEKVEKINSQTCIANVRHQRGAGPEAKGIFRHAEALQKELPPNEPYLYSVRGFWFCDLLLDQGQRQQVLTRAGHTLVIAQKNLGKGLGLHDIGLDHLSLGRAYLAKLLEEGERNLSQAAGHFNEAVNFLRQAGAQHYLVRGLLGRAAFFQVTGDSPQAHRDLEEAMEMAQRSGMRLYEADAHLEYAHLHLAQGEKEEARQSLAIAKEMIQQMGYHRRDREVKELEEQS